MATVRLCLITDLPFTVHLASDITTGALPTLDPLKSAAWLLIDAMRLIALAAASACDDEFWIAPASLCKKAGRGHNT